VNLIGNAIKFTPRGGDVAMRVAAELSPDPSARTVLLTFDVEDKGIGMTLEQRAALFQPFQQGDTSTTRRFGGTGLGLNITRRLVDAMGGTIEVTSEPGRGSRFLVRVPVPLLGPGPSWWERPTPVASPSTRFKEPVHRPEKPSLPETRGDVLRGRVLLAEDSPDTQRVLLYHLNRVGLSVDIAENGRVAVEKGLCSPFDVVLMDMQMPELDGYAAATELRRAGYNGPIIALTAHAMSDDREKCLAAGCSDYLTKPITPALLIETLAPFLARQDPPKPSPAESRADIDGLVREFEQRMRPRAEEIRTAFTTGDLARARLLAHQTKGTSGMYGYPAISEAARLLEQAIARGSATPEIVEFVYQLGEVIRETLPEQA
jgi:CheY-like chemotaxis protein/HPt (histidine-containing phosphotransfer) domain-containing protein